MLKTSESVGAGHPDKLCDQIADAVLDAHLAVDPMSRVACEVAAPASEIIVFGEITSEAQLDLEAITRAAMRGAGYDGGGSCLDPKTFPVRIRLVAQSPEIAAGVGRSSTEDPFDAIGAGDQGTVFGYATDETSEAIPAPLAISHRLMRGLHELRSASVRPEHRAVGPDAKAQATVRYEGGSPVHLETLVLSIRHDRSLSLNALRDLVRADLLPLVDPALIDDKTRLLLNPAGAWHMGGPAADSGLTGRKIIVDTYGGWAKHGGGAFSGKDPTKVDRSGAYAARQAALSLVRSGLAREVEVAVSYAIGVARPVAIAVNTYGTGVESDDALAALIEKQIDFRPAAIIERLGLRRPIYAQTARFGHIGRGDVKLSWETPIPINIGGRSFAGQA
jgi:S-adenosylmethionine synthetase